MLLTKIRDAIRTGLSSKGMKETPDRPDLTVTFSLAEQGQRGVVGRGILKSQVITTSEGTLVIEMTSGNSLVWHGTYTDGEGDAGKLARKSRSSFHSCRNATDGSTRIARRTGTPCASRATPKRAAAAAMNVAG